ncbi:serine hydrolase [Marinicrinis lubricantis]|uniref:Serine hydrolase n=1 Tax=Marinicrinis lubricantis TaxID=2086470 RepID=A0ABW1IKQ2_9BACL
MHLSKKMKWKSSLAMILVTAVLLFPLLQSSKADAAAREQDGLNRLETILEPIIQAAQEDGIEAAVAVQDLSGTFGHEKLQVGSSDSYLAASTIKLALITALMQEVEAGTYSLEDTITVTPDVVVGGAGTLKNEEFPQDVTIEHLARLMITQSDNTATNVLIDLVGFARVETLIDELDFEVMQLGRKMMTTANPPEQENYVNADELVRLLELIYKGDLVSAASRDQIIEWMMTQEVKTKFGAALPGKPIAHKTGELGDVSHDVGYFLIPDKEIAISVLTKVTRPEDAGKAQELGNPIVQRIAKAVYNFIMDYPAPSDTLSSWPAMSVALVPIIDEAEQNGIRVSVGIKNLSGAEGDREVLLGSRQSYAPASTIKLALVSALMKQVDAGELTLDQTVTVEPEDVVGGTGSLQEEQFPQDVTIERLARLMITQSDNTATNVLIDVVGLDKVADLMDELNLEVMHLGRKMFASAPTPEEDNYIDAADLITLLGAIYNEEFLSKASKDQIIEWMEAQEVDTKFGAALPDAPIAHKTGENANVTHDTGYFLIPGNEVAISVLTEVTTTSDFDEAQDIGNPIVQSIAKKVYETLTFAFPFTDVPANHEARAYIEAAAAAGFMGTPADTMFGPELPITRAEFVSLLVKAVGVERAGALPSFTDVPGDSPYGADIATAQEMGITSGISAELFGYENIISRAEMSAMLVRVYERWNGAFEDATELTYLDTGSIPKWAMEAVSKLQPLNVMEDYGDGTFRPDESVTRSDAVKAVITLLGL